MNDAVRLYLIALHLNLSTAYIELSEEDIAAIHKHVERKGDKFIPINNPLLDINKIKQVDEEIDIDVYRTIFKGIRRGSMGIKDEVYRKVRDCLLKLDISFEMLCELANQHVEENGIYSKSANYFIEKNIIRDGKRYRESVLEDMLLIINNNQEFNETI